MTKGIVICLVLSCSLVFGDGVTCREYVQQVAKERSANLSGWYNPIGRIRLQRQLETPVIDALGKYGEKELDPDFKRAIELEIAELVEAFETKRNSKLSGKAKAAYVISALLGTGALVATDVLDEPMRSVARLFVLGMFTKFLNAASAPVDSRVNGAVSSWVSKQPGSKSLPDRVSEDAKRVAQQAPRVAEPVEQDGVNKLLDGIRTVAILLGDADRWAEKGDDVRAVQQVRNSIETYLLYYSYFKKSERRIRRNARTYLIHRDHEFRERVYQMFAAEEDREVSLVDVARVLDAWMPHTKIKRQAPWAIGTSQIDTNGVSQGTPDPREGGERPPAPAVDEPIGDSARADFRSPSYLVNGS